MPTTKKPAKIANKPGTNKGGNPSWKKGIPSPNPAGRPKDGESWASVIKSVSNMDIDDLLLLVGKNNQLGRMISKLPRQVQIKYLVTARVIASLMFEPSHGLFRELMDRAEGKVKEHIEIDSRLNVENLTGVLDQVYGGNPDSGRASTTDGSGSTESGTTPRTDRDIYPVGLYPPASHVEISRSGEAGG